MKRIISPWKNTFHGKLFTYIKKYFTRYLFNIYQGCILCMECPAKGEGGGGNKNL